MWKLFRRIFWTQKGSGSVPEFQFTSHSPLNGYSKAFAGVMIAEKPECWITSISIPENGKAPLQAALLAGFKLQIPEMGRATTSGFANAYLLGMREKQWFLVSRSPLSKQASDGLKTNAYLTDQSDNWGVLSVSGAQSRAVLARICPVDLHKAKFPIGNVVRTLMAHQGVIIYRQGDDSFRLLVPSSSARSFVQVLEAAAISALGEKQ